MFFRYDYLQYNVRVLYEKTDDDSLDDDVLSTHGEVRSFHFFLFYVFLYVYYVTIFINVSEFVHYSVFTIVYTSSVLIIQYT